MSRAIQCGSVVALAIVILTAVTGPSGPARAMGRGSSIAGADLNGLNCTGAGWNNAHLGIGLSSCQAGLEGQYLENSTAIPNETNGYNFSYNFAWVGEFTPAGQLVHLASPLAPVAASANRTMRGDEVNLSIVQVLNVTNASGKWVPNDTWAGGGPQWNISSNPIGTAVFRLAIQLNVSQFTAAANRTENASTSVKFDVGVSGWPWAAKTDELGFMLDSLGAWGSHFTYNSTSSTLSEKWNATNRTFISVVFGGAANVTYPSGPGAVANVEDQAGLYPAGIPDRSAVVLVTFAGVAGNYSQVAYDPWVVLSLLPGTSPTGPPPSGSSGGWPTWLVVAAAVTALVAGLAGLAGRVVQDQRLRREGDELVRGVRSAIGEEPGAPGRTR